MPESTLLFARRFLVKLESGLLQAGFMSESKSPILRECHPIILLRALPLSKSHS
jgi:hypothetical protein